MKSGIGFSLRAIAFAGACFLLALSLLATRTSLVWAQAEAEGEDEAVALPREPEAAEEEAALDEDEDDAGLEPPPEDEVIEVYVVQAGDSLWRIARRLEVPFALLAEQT